MKNIEFIAGKLGWLYNDNVHQLILTSCIVALIMYTNLKINCENKLYILGIIICFTIILYCVACVLKNMINSTRPCKLINDDDFKFEEFCPSSNDIPSMHSAFGIFHGLILYNCGYTWATLPFFIQPFVRYVGKQHSLIAVVTGSILGATIYFTMQNLIKKQISSV